jgi:Mg-chelatase subunit ChlD
MESVRPTSGHDIMFNSWVDFDAPLYLVLLLLLPVFWFVGRRSIRSLGSWQQTVALWLRLAVATLLVFTLAEPNWLTLMHRLTVLFVVDASDSIEREELSHALNYVNAAAKQRDSERGDRAGVLVYGGEAGVEIPPLDQSWQLARIESEYRPQFTNLEAALKLAKATFPTDSAKRVVIVSDGNENEGRAKPLAAELLNSGVGIDCVPISYERKGDVRIDKVAVPADVRRSTPFSVRVVLENLRPDRTVSGKLRITRSLGGVEHLVSEDSIQLEPGKRSFTMPQELTDSGVSTYEARFVPDDSANDVYPENNVATGFCRVAGQGHVLLIEDAALVGRFDAFIGMLRRNDIEVTVRDTRRPFDDLADLQQFDCVVLADVGRVTGEGAEDITQFSDSQIHALVQNTDHFGCGLIVLGGPNSYGAGGWAKTELEKALPVDFDIDNAKVDAVGALLLVIDSSGSMSGPKIAWSKAAAIAATKMLGKRDFLGVVSFDSEPHWIVPMQRNGVPARSQSRIDRLGAGGGTDMMPALEQGYRAIQGVNASLKHVVVLTDGQTPKGNYASLVTKMKQQGITTTGVAVGGDADRMLLADIGRRGGGKFYQVLSPRAIPRIFMREARRVAMPLVFEDQNGIAMRLGGNSEVLTGIQTPPPPTTGYVLTTLKQDSLVEVLLSTPRQVPANSTILAAWQFGLGRSAALTTDIGERWASDWPAWGNYEKMMLQLVRWCMRGHDMNDQLAMTTDADDGEIEVLVNAIDQDDAHINFLSLMGTVITPNGQSQSFSLQQIAPGRYTAKLPTDEPGNYYLAVSDGGRTAPLRAAINVSATAELDDLFSYDGFLAELAEGKPKGGEPGRLIQSPRGIADTPGLLNTNVFRPGLAPAKSRDAMWPVVLLVASAVFLGDVVCRRVLISFDWLPQLGCLVMRRCVSAPVADGTQRMQRLKQTKMGATARYEQARDSALNAIMQQTTDASAPAVPESHEPAITVATSTPPAPEAAGELSEFTSRLLAAKKRVHDQQPQ